VINVSNHNHREGENGEWFLDLTLKANELRRRIRIINWEEVDIELTMKDKQRKMYCLSFSRLAFIGQFCATVSLVGVDVDGKDYSETFRDIISLEFFEKTSQSIV
jgi:hypothetical protein